MQARCPAAELTRGTLSLNRCDVRCGVAGFLRDAEGSPCVDEYTECSIWRTEKERTWKQGKAKRSELLQTATGGWE